MIEGGGLSGLTFDAVARETGMTKSGLVYHFPSKEDMLMALHEYLASAWEDNLIEALGVPYEESTPDQRAAAYVRTQSQAMSRVELLLMIDAASHPEYIAPWAAVTSRWAAPVEGGQDDAGFRRAMANLAADGLWVYDILNAQTLPAEVREEFAERIARTVDGADGRGGSPEVGEPRG